LEMVSLAPRPERGTTQAHASLMRTPGYESDQARMHLSWEPACWITSL